MSEEYKLLSSVLETLADLRSQVENCDGTAQIDTDAADAVLARWGHQPTPPAEGEVAELAAKLRRLAPHNPLGTADPTITRAADLLLQQEARIAELDQKLEIERMRVVACGAVAMADSSQSQSLPS